jgi:FAD dependent monooxygenase
MEPPTNHRKKPFRAVIIGAGIVGLSLSHALQLANIDHIVLEKHKEIVSLRGSALVLFPSAARILDQFGILEIMRSSTVPVQREFIRQPDGSVITRPSNHRNLEEIFGVAPISLDRHSLVRYLYDGLPDKSTVRTDASIDRMEVRRVRRTHSACKTLTSHSDY